MNWHQYFSSVQRPVQACLVGSGGFGHSFLAQTTYTSLLECRVVVDVEASIAVACMTSAGIAEDRIKICGNQAEARAAWDGGFHIAARSFMDVAGLPLDILVEATGNPEAGARHAAQALEHGLHVALVSKEVDSVIGPGLVHKAKGLGKVVTPVDGDQPSLLIGLISWAQVLGLEIVAAGKASEYDFVYHRDDGQMHSNGTIHPVPGFEKLWRVSQDNMRDVVCQRAVACAAFPQRAVPDFCEMQVVANWTGLVPDRPDFHVPILRIQEVPEALRCQFDGGLLQQSGTLDVFHCLRAPDELSFAGGVFVVVRCADDKSWALLHDKGHVLARDRKTALIYLPRHLLGLEAATSLIEAAALNVSSGGDVQRPIIDLVGRATTDLAMGHSLQMGGHHHEVQHLSPELVPASVLSDHAPVPYYLLANCTLVRPVSKGELITLQDISADRGSSLYQLRKYQDSITQY